MRLEFNGNRLGDVPPAERSCTSPNQIVQIQTAPVVVIPQRLEPLTIDFLEYLEIRHSL